MAKVIRKELEQKLAALGGAEWDSMSESDLSGEDNDETVNETSDGEELKSPPLPLHAQQKKGKDNKRKGKGGSVVPVGPAGEPSGVVRIGHIPHGFYEEAMNGFFKQFGDVIRVRISRSKKSGRSKGYAYVEFVSPEVAGIVAETMDGYYLFDKQLVCRVLRFDEIHPNLFDGAGVKFRKVNWHGLYRQKYNADRTPAKDEKHTSKLLKKDKDKKAKLAKLGIEYDFPGFVATLNDRQAAEEPAQGKGQTKRTKRNSQGGKGGGKEGGGGGGEGGAGEEATLASPGAEEEKGKSGTAAAGAKASPKKKAPANSAKKSPAGSAKKPAAASSKKSPAAPAAAAAAAAAAATATTPKGKGKGKGNAKTPTKATKSKAIAKDAAAVTTPAAATAAAAAAGAKGGKSPGSGKAKGSDKKSKGLKTPEAAAGSGKKAAKSSAKKGKGAETPEPAVAAAAAGVGSGGKKKAKSPKSGGGGGKKRSLEEDDETAAAAAAAAPATGSGKKSKGAKRSKV